MEKAVIKRVRFMLKYYDMTQIAFCRKTNISATTLNSIFMRDSDIKTSVIVRILSAFEDISAEWLLRGEGEMLRLKESTTSDIVSHMADNSTTLMALQAQRELIEMQRELIEMQREKSAELTKLLADNKKISTST